MFNAIKRIKATKQHLWFLSKYNFSTEEEILAEDFFCSFSKAFVVAPHMDDEIHGSFALIKKLLELKKEVSIVYCISSENGVETTRRIAESKIVFPDVKKIYLGINDSNAENEIDILKAKLSNILKSVDSLYVFPEYAVSNHKDHNVVNKVMEMICAEQNHLLVLKTELIVPIKRSCFLKIEKFSEKIKELEKYKTQKSRINYKKISIYLSTSGNRHEFREHYAK